MLEMQKSTTIQGTSSVQTTDGTNVAVANLYANIAENGAQSITKTITDKDLYLKYREDIETDMAVFEETALAMVQ